MRSEWEEVSLGDIFNVKHGFAFKGEFFVNDPTDTVLVTPGNFAVGGGFQNPKPKYYDGPVPEGYILVPGQVLVTMTDLSKQSDTLGYPALVPEDGNTWLHNQRVGLLEFKTEYPCDPIFINYFLRSHNYRSWILGSASGTTVKHTSPDRIHVYRCDLPSLLEQKAIAHVLGTLDDRIELNRQMNETLESMAQALFKSWFVDFDPVIDNALASGKDIPEELREKAQARAALGDKREPLSAEIRTLFPDEFIYSDELGWIPEGWEVTQIKNFGKVTTGKTPPKKIEQAFGDTEVPFITPSDIDNSVFVASTTRSLSNDGQNSIKNSYIHSGSICVTCIGSQMGKTVIAPKDSFTNQQINSVSIKDEHSRNYLFLNLRNRREEILTIGSSGSTMPIINKSTFERLPVLLPGGEVLKSLNELVASFLDSILSRSLYSQSLSEVRNILLPKLLSGELRIPDAEKMVEEMAL